MKNMKFRAVIAFFSFLLLVISSQAQAQGQRQQPPEYKEVVAASRIQDAAARLKEFERIKSAYPNANLTAVIDQYILTSKIELAGTLADVLNLQKDFMGKSQGPRRLQNPYMAAEQILEHPKLANFDKAKVTETILKYEEDAVKAASDPETFKGIPESQQKSYKSFFVTGMKIAVAQAHLNAADANKALTALESYKAAGGAPDATYSNTLAEVYAKLGKINEAYNAYLDAAIEDYKGAKDKAKALYVKLNGKPEGFEAQVEAKLKELPYQPEPFKPSADWKGKAVLAEIFTGSECPPCVGADLGFDGLIESYPSKYLVILEYHLPIPRPDPIMNPATKKRQDDYAVNSTPTVVIDGDKKMIGGGSRGMAEGKFKEYKSEIDARINAAPAVSLKAKAARAGDSVKVVCEFDKAVPGVEYYVVLVQNEEKYKGSNGIAFHKLVVRDLIVLDPAGTKQASFDLAASEQATDRYLTEFENTNTRFQGFKFPERHHKIDRRGLKVVFFAQEKEGQKVLNAVVADAK
jgi:thiol-disulfide isomerase/thioredoxin